MLYPLYHFNNREIIKKFRYNHFISILKLFTFIFMFISIMQSNMYYDNA